MPKTTPTRHFDPAAATSGPRDCQSRSLWAKWDGQQTGRSAAAAQQQGSPTMRYHQLQTQSTWSINLSPKRALGDGRTSGTPLRMQTGSECGILVVQASVQVRACLSACALPCADTNDAIAMLQNVIVFRAHTSQCRFHAQLPGPATRPSEWSTVLTAVRSVAVLLWQWRKSRSMGLFRPRRARLTPVSCAAQR